MTIQIEVLCDSSSSTCARGVFLSCYSALILAASLYCLCQLIRHLGRIPYEALPLTTCAIQSVLHLIDFMFLINNKLQIVIVFFCLQTYLLVAQSLVHIYYKLTLNVPQFKEYFKYMIIIMLSTIIFMVSITILCTVMINSLNCNSYFDMGLTLQFATMAISAILCIYYGNNVIKQIQSNDTAIVQTTQITLVQYVVGVSSLLFFIMMLVEILYFNDIFCNIAEGKTYTLGENLYLIFFSILEMTPCILVPVVFYYVPNIPKLPDDEFQLNDQMIEIQLESEQEFTDYLKSL